MTAYAAVSGRMERHRSGLVRALAPLAAGIAAGVANSVFYVPSEMVKQRVQAGAEGGALQAVAHVLDADGLAGLYRGLGPAPAPPRPAPPRRPSPGLRAWWLRAASREGGELAPVESLLCGGLAGACAQFLTTPLDLAKTLTMLGTCASPGAALKATLAAGGPGALFAGGLLRIGMGFVYSAAFFVVLEAATSRLRPLLDPPELD
eukprot:tig00001095_g7045.t1